MNCTVYVIRRLADGWFHRKARRGRDSLVGPKKWTPDLALAWTATDRKQIIRWSGLGVPHRNPMLPYPVLPDEYEIVEVRLIEVPPPPSEKST